MDKFRSILFTLNPIKYVEQQMLGWKFPKKTMSNEYFKKWHIKTVISI